MTDHFIIVLTHLAQVWFVKMNHFNENRSHFYIYRKSFIFGPLKFNSPLIILFFFFPLNSDSCPWEKQEGKKVIFHEDVFVEQLCSLHCNLRTPRQNVSCVTARCEDQISAINGQRMWIFFFSVRVCAKQMLWITCGVMAGIIFTSDTVGSYFCSWFFKCFF